MRKISTVFLAMLLAGCATTNTITLNRPTLPIFTLSKYDDHQTRLNAYKDSLDLMIMYSNELEKVIKLDHNVDYNIQ